MKHIKKFNEELSPHIYRSAARDFKYYNKDKKSNELNDWADEKEFGFYNMIIASDKYILGECKFTRPELIGLYYGEFKDNILNMKDTDKFANELVNLWKNGSSELSLTMEYGFKPSANTIDMHSYFKDPQKDVPSADKRWLNGSIPIFSLSIHLSDWYDGLDEWDAEAKDQAEEEKEEFKPSTLYDLYQGSKYESIFIMQNSTTNTSNINKYYGLFSDRLSANRFNKFIKSSSSYSKFDVIKEKIMDILNIVGGESDDIERILGLFNKIKVHGLYDDYNYTKGSYNSTNTDNLSRKWFSKKI